MDELSGHVTHMFLHRASGAHLFSQTAQCHVAPVSFFFLTWLAKLLLTQDDNSYAFSISIFSFLSSILKQ